MILMYHKVYPESPTMWWVDADSFYRQMCELKCRKVVYLDDYDPADPDQVVITFDGVYKNVLTFAAPILKDFGYPFELFVTSDYIGEDNSFDASEPKADFTSVEDLKELVSCGGRLQWHTKTHRNLKEVVDSAEIASELAVPDDLRQLDDKGFRWFAYPHGDFNSVLVEQTKMLFKGGISCIQGNDTDLFILNRVTVTNETTFKKGSLTVIIASYNYGSYMIEAIESVLRQTRPVDEILIADDCSTDNTMEIGLEYQKRYPELIRYFRNEQNLGIVKNFNKSVSMAKGDYICFLGADNRFRSDYIERTSEILDSDDRIAIAYTDFAMFGQRAKIMYQERFQDDMKGPIVEDYYYIVNFPEFDEAAKKRLDRENIFHGSSMFRKLAFQDVGGYKDENDMPEDYNLFVRMVKKGWSAKRVPSPVLEYRQHSREQSQLKAISNAELSYYKTQYKLASHEFAQKIHELADRDRQLAEKDQHLVQKDQQLAQRDQQLVQKDQHLIQRDQHCAEREQQLAEKTQELNLKERQLVERESQLAQRDQRIQDLLNSISWKITLPLRKAYELLRSIVSPQRWNSLAAVFGRRNLRNAVHVLKTYEYRRAISNIRAYGIKTFLRNAKRELFGGGSHDTYTPASASRETGVPEREKAASGEKAGYRDDYFEYLFSTNIGSSEDYVPLSSPNIPETDIKLIAFYLPQFHPIPENDEWWGKGFTEWTNVTKAVPQFIGHYQPRLPGELGFYDLRIPEIQKRQIELARQYGIHGFCFHFYWFSGKRLLERPLEQFFLDPDMDFPFCISWANESWSRRWEGREEAVLIRQEHSATDDIAFIEYVAKYLRDKRYIRINSKPLLMVYRPALLHDPKKTAERWRQWCRGNGIGEIYLALTHSFEHIDPREIGFDAAIEFAPNTFPLKDVRERFQVVNDEFDGRLFDYHDALNLARRYKKHQYKKFRSLCPSWDNEARKPGKGTVLTNANPEAYKEWLKMLCEYTIDHFEPEERLIFINAWNEWAEGAYLEPDRKYGYAYLNSTAEVLATFPKGSAAHAGKWKVLFVSHDAAKGGAQSVLVNIIAWFKKHTFVDLKILCLDDGELLSRFEELGDTLVLKNLKEKTISKEDMEGMLWEFCGGSPDLIYCNTVAAGREYKLLSGLNAPIITHFHELEMSIKRYAADWLHDVLNHSAHFIACSGAVRENLLKNHGVERTRISTVYASINPEISVEIPMQTERRTLRKRLGIGKRKFLVFGCGLGMVFRKGADLFIEVARILKKKGVDDFHFYWIGSFDMKESDECYGKWTDFLAAIRKDGLDDYVTFLGLKDNPRDYLRAGDVFLLPSREDPFPLVTLEAAECGLPTVCFADAGGMPDFVEEDAGFVVAYEDVAAMAEKVIFLMKNEDIRRKLGLRAREKVLSDFTFEHTAPQILSVCRKVARKKPTVSVIVPNYNHERYLSRRLDSIFAQTFKDFEVILLDDASTDNSIEVLEKYAGKGDVRIVKNDLNTGSPFIQWLKGIDMARADILWIAESDDVCEPQFLATLLPAFRNPMVKLAYADSYVIDENDEITGDYVNCEYLTSLSETKWKKNYQVSAVREINDGLGVKNTILNISAVLFRKFELDNELRKTLQGMRIAGDWLFVTHSIKGGNVYYAAKKLNYHRRHSESVIGRTILDEKVEDFFREFYSVQQFIFSNYKLADDFYEKWERYLRKLWNDFYPQRPFEDMGNYYPVDEMKEKILHHK